MELDNFRKQVRDALEHLYDTAYLETHPLLLQFPNQPADSRLTRAQKLRGLLKEAIEALRPPEGSPAGSPEWRSYLALRYRYVQGLSHGEVESELGISLRQLQRELHKGLDAVATALWEKRVALPASAPDETQALERELNEWHISRQNCAVQTLVDDTLWMCQPLFAERGIRAQNDLPARLAPVYVDATLTRQALFHVLRVLARAPGTLTLDAREESKETHLVLQSETPRMFEREANWRLAQVICQQLGIQLAARQLAEGRTEIALTLPRASQPRVLMIDDNAALHTLFERYLTPQHYELLHAYNGQTALQLAATRPDVITLDVMMPNVDGWQVLRALTSDPATARIPVVICSVLKEPQLAFALGARAYLKKPVDRNELATTLARLLSSADRAAAESPTMPADNSASRS
ncbi:MAG: response regulator [Chloroflexi bacterium]|nr:response regulator [Chloroflexota bacterium]